MKRRNVGQLDGVRRGFLILLKVTATRRVGEVNNAMYIRRINAMVVPFVFKTSQNAADRKALLNRGASENFIDINIWKPLKIGRNVPT